MWEVVGSFSRSRKSEGRMTSLHLPTAAGHRCSLSAQILGDRIRGFRV